MLAVYGEPPFMVLDVHLLICYQVSLAMEAIGDITASAEVSRQPVVGDVFDSRIQGGILSDGLGGFFSALFTVTPLSVFAQNNGVIAITRCANRGAGRWCCAFLILFGVLGKLSGVFLAIPNSGPRRRDDVPLRERRDERSARARVRQVHAPRALRARRRALVRAWEPPRADYLHAPL